MVLFNEAGRTAVHLWGRDVNVSINEIEMPQAVEQRCRRGNIGGHPLFGILPALAHHALRCVINDDRGLYSVNQLSQRLQIAIDIDPVKAKTRRWFAPAIG
jgi:hypothetical protein